MTKKQRIEIKQSEDMQQIDDELDEALRALDDANTKVNEVLEVEKAAAAAPLFAGLPNPAAAADAAQTESASESQS